MWSSLPNSRRSYKVSGSLQIALRFYNDRQPFMIIYSFWYQCLDSVVVNTGTPTSNSLHGLINFQNFFFPSHPSRVTNLFLKLATSGITFSSEGRVIGHKKGLTYYYRALGCCACKEIVKPIWSLGYSLVFFSLFKIGYANSY